MRASEAVLARRYAQALFLAALEHRQDEDVRRELADAHRALAARLGELKSPTVALQEKKAIVRQAAGSLSPRTAHFIELLLDKKRISLLPAIVGDMSRIQDEHAGRIRAQVRTAADLSPEERDVLSRRLKGFSGKDVVLEARVDPELIAGIVVRMGDTVLDASLQGRLRGMAAKLAQGY